MPRAEPQQPLIAHPGTSSNSSSTDPGAVDPVQQEFTPWSEAEITEAAARAGEMSLDESDQVVPLNSEDPEARLHWMALPPMPTPRTGVMRSQACGGITVVLFIIVMCVAGTHWFTARADGTISVVLNVAVWIETIVAILCLLGLMYGNPGEIKRSEATCTVRVS